MTASIDIDRDTDEFRKALSEAYATAAAMGIEGDSLDAWAIECAETVLLHRRRQKDLGLAPVKSDSAVYGK